MCCKFFNNKVSASERVLLEHPYFNLPGEELQQTNFEGILQAGRKNNFNKLLLNELSDKEKKKSRSNKNLQTKKNCFGNRNR